MKWYDVPSDVKDSAGLPELPEGFEWHLQYTEDYDVDLSWCGKWVQKAPYSGWYVDRRKNKLINADSEYDEDLGDYTERLDVLYVASSFRPGAYLGYWIPENHDNPGNEENWEHVEQDKKDSIIEKWGSLRRQDIQYMLENHKYMEQAADGNVWFYIYSVELRYINEPVAFNTIGGVDGYFDDNSALECYRDLAHECIAQFLENRKWWLDIEALHTGYLNMKHHLLVKDVEYWDAIVARWDAAREFQRMHNDKDWWGINSTRNVIMGDVALKLDELKAKEDAKNKSEGDSC